MLEKINPLNILRDNEENGQEKIEKIEEKTKQKTQDISFIEEQKEKHKAITSAEAIEVEPRAIRIGDMWARTMWVDEWQNNPPDRFLEPIHTEQGARIHTAIHIKPKPTVKILNTLKHEISELTAELKDLKKEEHPDAQSVQKELTHRQKMKSILEEGTKLFDTSMYITVRDYDKNRMIQKSKQIEQNIKSPPSQLSAVTASHHRQKKVLTSTSPIAKDQLNKKSSMMSGAIGAGFPFSTDTVLEEGGIPYGYNTLNESPIWINRWKRGTGHNSVITGKVGAGKSVTTGHMLLHRYMLDKDLTVIIADPLNEYWGVNEALDGESITVGGKQSINPLEIQPTPQEVLEQNPQMDPLLEKQQKVMNFFQNFYSLEGENKKLGKKTGVLETAIKETYENAHITRDPKTHKNPSPTIKDLLKTLENIASHPEDYTTSSSDIEREKREEYASQLQIDFEPFKSGRYENLAQQTDVSFQGNDAFYLDLHQKEESGIGLTMQVLMNLVYERAKQDPNEPTLFAIDEAHRLIKNSSSLDFLETAVRHSRHFNLSFHFATQEPKDFFASDQTKTIINNCSSMIFHRSDGINEVSDNLNLNKKQVQHIEQELSEGSEETGYSEAVLWVDGKGFYPLQVVVTKPELETIKYGPDYETPDKQKIKSSPLIEVPLAILDDYKMKYLHQIENLKDIIPIAE